MQLGSKVLTWVSVHAGPKMWLSAFGYSDELGNCVDPDDYADIVSRIKNKEIK